MQYRKYPPMQKGEKYGRWTVVSYTSSYVYCVCDCGNKKMVYSGHLRTGHSKSCGCLKDELSKKCLHPEILGRRFGKLVAVKWIGIQKLHGRGYSVWRCQCDCGGTKDVIECSLLQSNTRSCGCMLENRVEINGITKSIADWGVQLGISRQRAHQLWKKSQLEKRILASNESTN